MVFRRVIANGGSYDSELFRPNRMNGSELSLKMQIHLRQGNPRGHGTTGTVRDFEDERAIVRWSDDDWRAHIRRFEQVCESIWNRSLFLVPPASLPGQVREQLASGVTPTATFPPYIICTLDVRMTERAWGSHASIRCYCLAESETFFRSYVQRRPGRNAGTLDSRDVLLRRSGTGADEVIFSTVAHEVGHLLGLSHPSGEGNDPAAYGAPGTPAYRSLMGCGSELTSNEARPWTRRIGQHTGVRRAGPSAPRRRVDRGDQLQYWRETYHVETPTNGSRRRGIPP